MGRILPLLLWLFNFLRANFGNIVTAISVYWTVKEVVQPGFKAADNLANAGNNISNSVKQATEDVNKKIDQAANFKLPGFPGGAVGAVVLAGVLGFILFLSEDK